MGNDALVWRFGVWILALELFAGAAIVSAVRTHVVEARNQAMQLSTMATARALAPRYATKAADPDALQNAVAEDSARTEMRIVVLDAAGGVIADSRRRDIGIHLHPLPPEVLGARTRDEATGVRYDEILLEPAQYAAIRIDDAHVLHLTAKRSLIEPHWRPVVLSSAICIGVIVGTGLILASMTTRFRSIMREIGARVREIGVETGESTSGHTTVTSVEIAIRRTHRELIRRIRELDAGRREAETILGSMGDGVIALDEQQTILSINSAGARILRVGARQVKGRLLQEAALEPSLNAFVRRALASGREETEELEFSIGGPSHVQATASPLIIASGDRRRGLLLVLSDVTRLRRLERIRSDFASNVSHELRTPITNIKGYVETLIQTGLDDKQQAEEFLKTISRNSARLGAIVDDIMALTRIEQSERVGSVELDDSSIRQILISACEEQAPEAEARRTTVEIQAPDDLVARVNADLMEQAVSNLVSNAVRYSKPGTHVLIRASRDADRSGTPGVRIEVTDQGPGIAPEHIPRLFERFYRVDRARSRGVGGTGLGLAIVKHIAIAHGGSVEVDSTPGVGSTFAIFVPLDPANAHPSPDPRGSGTSKATIE